MLIWKYSCTTLLRQSHVNYHVFSSFSTAAQCSSCFGWISCWGWISCMHVTDNEDNEDNWEYSTQKNINLLVYRSRCQLQPEWFLFSPVYLINVFPKLYLWHYKYPSELGLMLCHFSLFHSAVWTVCGFPNFDQWCGRDPRRLFSRFSSSLLYIRITLR